MRLWQRTMTRFGWALIRLALVGAIGWTGCGDSSAPLWSGDADGHESDTATVSDSQPDSPAQPEAGPADGQLAEQRTDLLTPTDLVRTDMSAPDVPLRPDVGPAGDGEMPAETVQATDTDGTAADSGPDMTDSIVPDAAEVAWPPFDAGGETADTAAPSDPCLPIPDDLPTVSVYSEGRYRYVDPFPGLGLRDRRVVVYLPADYDSRPQQHYPVLYMHDGQNLFNDSDAAFGVAWEVDDAVDALVAVGEIPPLIVVGIDNTDDRLDEYRAGSDPTVDDGSLAALYRRYLAERVRPWVDATFRTDCRRSQNVLMGSSMGAVASLSHALRYPDAWGRIGCVSSAFWYGDDAHPAELLAWTATHGDETLPDRIWQDVGTAESSLNMADNELYIQDSRSVRDWFFANGAELGESLAYFEDIGAIHSESAWEVRLPTMLRYLFGDPAALQQGAARLELYPVQSRLSLTQPTGTTLVVQHVFAHLTLTAPNTWVTFDSDDPSIATVLPEGRVLPQGVGSTTIRASYRGMEAATPIEVTANDTVTLVWQVQVPVGTPGDDGIYLAGNIPELGSWGEGFGEMRRMDPAGPNVWQTSLSLPLGTWIEYKYTRGSWATVEKDASGNEIANRTVLADDTITLQDTVQRWADQ